MLRQHTDCCRVKKKFASLFTETMFWIVQRIHVSMSQVGFVRTFADKYLWELDVAN